MTNSTSNRHGDAPFRFAVSATFTANPIEPVISFWGGHLKSDFEVRFAPYNQLVQTLLDPGGEFATNNHGVNIMLLRIEDLAQSASSVNGCGTAKLESNAQHLAQQVRSTAARFAVPLIVCVCPSASLPPQIEHAVGATLAACLVDMAGVQYLTHETIASWYPVEVVHDAEGERLGAIPYTELYYCALATALVRITHDLLMPPFKVVAVDCDNTLWSGICGEDGPENVRIEGPHGILQQFVLEQHDSGMLLTMASKNNEGDVLETFRVHPEMPLALRHFAGWRLNWEPKAENLVQLSEQLSLGLDSFIFIDDNPKECAEIKEALPEVLTITLPESAGKAEQLLRHVWAFDRLVLTEEDRNRNAYYSQAQEFGTELRQASNLEQFMASLELHVSIAPVSPDRLPRVAQLTQRTNQFNLTTLRRSELDLKSLMARGHEVFTVEVTDRFGDYGVVGVLIVRTNQDVLHVDTMLLSCRALGRGVEHRMASFLGQHADSCGIHSVDFRFDRTDKNVPARQFLEQIEPGSYLPDELGFTLKVPAAKLVDLRWRPTSAGPIEPTPASTSSSAHAPPGRLRVHCPQAF